MISKLIFILIISIIIFIFIININQHIQHFNNKLIKKEFSVITLFKNYTPTFFTFQNFYKELWQVNQFIYLVGYISNKDLSFIVFNCSIPIKEAKLFK